MTKSLVSRIVLVALMVSLLPGYPRASIAGHVLNVQAWINVFLLSLLTCFYLARHRKSIRILYLIALFVAYSLVGYVTVGGFAPVLAHAFTFAPFIIAFLLLELRIGHDIRVVLFNLTVCAAIGAVAANVIHFFVPDLLESLLKEEEDISAVISLGRVAWSGYVVALPLMIQLGMPDLYTPRRRTIALVCLSIVVAGALLTFNRTLLIGLLCMGIYLLLAGRKQIGLKAIPITGAIYFAGSYFLTWWSEVNPSLRTLIDYRILFFFTGGSDTSGDVSTRGILYGQYLDRLTHRYFLGQGLGVPVSTYLGDSFWADITLVNIMVPFGVFGLILFVSFVRQIYSRIRTRITEPRIQRLFLLVLLLAIGISLNDDIWTHKSFAVYFVFLINSYQTSLPVPRRRPKDAIEDASGDLLPVGSAI